MRWVTSERSRSPKRYLVIVDHFSEGSESNIAEAEEVQGGMGYIGGVQALRGPGLRVITKKKISGLKKTS